MVKETKRKPRDAQSMIDMANSVLAIALVSIESLAEMDLSIDHFPLAWQQDTWSAVQFLYTSKSKVDVVLVSERLSLTGKECPEGSWLGMLATIIRDSSATSHNSKSYADSLIQWRRRSRCAEIGNELLTKSMDGQDGSDEAIRDLMALSSSNAVMDGPLADSIPEAVDALDRRCSRESKVHGIPYGIAGLDNLLSGMENSHLIILAGRPAMGKTAAALCICENNRQRPIGFISTEQPRREMINRLVSIHGRVSSHDMRKGTVSEADWPKVADAYSSISKWPLYMSDRPAPDLSEIVRQARRWKHRYGIELLVVDYIQRVKVKGSTKRHEEVGDVASTLKNVARELEIPVLALSQINRDVEKRENKRPVMSDLRESGDIEQEADIIITQYRDEVYYDDPNNKGRAEFGVPKNRHGPIGIAKCHFEAQYLRFEDFGIEQLALEDIPPAAPSGQPRDNFTYRPA